MTNRHSLENVDSTVVNAPCSELPQRASACCSQCVIVADGEWARKSLFDGQVRLDDVQQRQWPNRGRRLFQEDRSEMDMARLTLP